jgi:hypothetical protein
MDDLLQEFMGWLRRLNPDFIWRIGQDPVNGRLKLFHIDSMYAEWRCQTAIPIAAKTG